MLPILMYHTLWPELRDPRALEAYWAADPQLSDPGARRYGLPVPAFFSQLDLLVKRGFKTLNRWDSILKEDTAKKRILLTFDDGHFSNYEFALPALQSRGGFAAFFVTTDWIGTKGFMNANHIIAMRRSGMLIGSHACSHAFLSDLDARRLERELRESKKKLEQILQEPVVALALPGGRNHKDLRRMAADCGYQYVFTSRIAVAQKNESPLDLPRIPILNTIPQSELDQLLKGDDKPVRRMARAALIRNLAKKLLGNKSYEKLRSALLRSGK